MRVLLAPDSFKGSLGAPQAAAAMARGVRAALPQAEIRLAPVADGGEGTLEALVAATGGRVVPAEARGPLGKPLAAAWGLLGDGHTAVVEMARASGLTQVPPAFRDPLAATTLGTGDLLKAALDAGVHRIIVGLGGSATTDGGAGMVQSLGARFLDAQGRDLPPGGEALARLDTIRLEGLDPRLARTELLVACDVDAPLCGPRGAARVFAPQKGADPRQVDLLDGALARYARVAEGATGRPAAQLPGAGAAGGLGAGFLFFTGARLRPGVELVLEFMRFQKLLEGVDLVITGEGRTDAQTALGKAPLGVASLARKAGAGVICLSGGLGEGAEALLERGVDALMSATPGPMSLETCLERAEEHLEAAAFRACRLLFLGARMAGGWQ